MFGRESLRKSSRRLLLVLLILAGCAAPSRNKDPLDIVLPSQWIGNIDQAGFNEPSGITFYPPSETLFVVGDEGDICEIQLDGVLIRQKRIRDADFEGITFNPATGLLYVAVEGEESIIEIEPTDLSVRREFTIDRTYNGTTVLASGGQGIEAITFVPLPDHLEGGLFYVANQSFTLDTDDDVSAIVEVEVPLNSTSFEHQAARITKLFRLDVIDLSGLHYDVHGDNLYAISDAANVIMEITRAGDVLRSYAFPGDNQEGITLDNRGFLYIAQDSGGIIKYRWNLREGR